VLLVTIMTQVTCPQNPRSFSRATLQRQSPKLLRSILKLRPSDYYRASELTELGPTFRQGADTWAKHLATSAAGRAATFGMILIVQGFQTTNRNWHVRCCDHFAYYEICNKRVHKRETAMNAGEVMMSNACQVG